MYRILLLAALLAAQLAADDLLDAMLQFGRGDARAGIASLQKLAENGNVQAQIFLGGLYLHPVPAAKEVIPEPDYAASMKWFMRASTQGSGQASAAIGEMYEGGLGVPKSDQKAIEWFDLAAKQGWDQQQLEVECFMRTPGPQSISCSSDAAGLACPTEAEIQAMQTAGLTGALTPFGTGHRDRAGPKARALIIMDQPIGGEVRLKQPRRANVIYVQGATGWQMIPPNAPMLDRAISLQPQSDAPRYTTVFEEDVDGSKTGGSCVAWPPERFRQNGEPIAPPK